MVRYELYIYVRFDNMRSSNVQKYARNCLLLYISTHRIIKVG